MQRQILGGLLGIFGCAGLWALGMHIPAVLSLFFGLVQPKRLAALFKKFSERLEADEN